MILALDTDVLVHWLMSGTDNHPRARRLIDGHLAQSEHGTLGLTRQVLHEFIHVTTDSRRFENPMSMKEAIRAARTLWDGLEVTRLQSDSKTLHRTLELLEIYRLGRKRILDTSLAATLESCGVSKLATFNGKDFGAFGFIEVVEP